MINAIFAIDQEGGMGLDNSMPWPTNQQDLDWFKMHTVGHIVVMGNGTWNAKDMPTPLPGRINWVITSSKDSNLYNVNVWNKNPIQLLFKLERETPSKTVWVIGGAKLLSSTEGVFDRLYVTHFNKTFKCDTKVDFTSLSLGYKKIYSKKYSDMEHVIYEKLSSTIN